MSKVILSLIPSAGKIYFLLMMLVGSHVVAAEWKPLMNDGLHDPTNAGVKWLQNPGAALSRLPSDSAGNKVDWVRAISEGYIQPRSSLHNAKPVEVLDLDIVLNEAGSQPGVMFPHKPHTVWLDCENCHDKIFKEKTGETPITMEKILQGEYCGVCHGGVSFPLTECNRCHTVSKKKAKAE